MFQGSASEGCILDLEGLSWNCRGISGNAKHAVHVVHLRHCLPGRPGRTHVELSVCSTKQIRRAHAACAVIYVPTYPPPAGAHYELKVTPPMSEEMLQRAYSVYGVERVPTAGGKTIALAGQE